MKTLNLGVVMEQGADFNAIIGIKGVNGFMDLTGYAFLGEMRLSTSTASPVAGGVRSTGTITLTANPAPGDTLDVNGTIVTFVAAAPVGNEVLIGTNAFATLSSLRMFLASSLDANIKLATYLATASLVITVTNILVGVVGDTFTLATVSAAITLSGATLLGGIEPAEFIFTILDQVTNKGQVRWFLPATIVNTIVASVSNSIQSDRLKTPYVFDIKMKDTANIVTRIIQGIIFLSPQATQEIFP